MRIVIEGGSPTLRRLLLWFINGQLPSWCHSIEDGESIKIICPEQLARFI